MIRMDKSTGLKGLSTVHSNNCSNIFVSFLEKKLLIRGLIWNLCKTNYALVFLKLHQIVHDFPFSRYIFLITDVSIFLSHIRKNKDHHIRK